MHSVGLLEQCSVLSTEGTSGPLLSRGQARAALPGSQVLCPPDGNICRQLAGGARPAAGVWAPGGSRPRRQPQPASARRLHQGQVRVGKNLLLPVLLSRSTRRTSRARICRPCRPWRSFPCSGSSHLLLMRHSLSERSLSSAWILEDTTSVRPTHLPLARAPFLPGHLRCHPRSPPCTINEC